MRTDGQYAGRIAVIFGVCAGAIGGCRSGSETGQDGQPAAAIADAPDAWVAAAVDAGLAPRPLELWLVPDGGGVRIGDGNDGPWMAPIRLRARFHGLDPRAIRVAVTQDGSETLVGHRLEAASLDGGAVVVDVVIDDGALSGRVAIAFSGPDGGLGSASLELAAPARSDAGKPPPKKPVKARRKKRR